MIPVLLQLLELDPGSVDSAGMLGEGFISMLTYAEPRKDSTPPGVQNKRANPTRKTTLESKELTLIKEMVEDPGLEQGLEQDRPPRPSRSVLIPSDLAERNQDLELYCSWNCTSFCKDYPDLQLGGDQMVDSNLDSFEAEYVLCGAAVLSPDLGEPELSQQPGPVPRRSQANLELPQDDGYLEMDSSSITLDKREPLTNSMLNCYLESKLLEVYRQHLQDSLARSGFPANPTLLPSVVLPSVDQLSSQLSLEQGLEASVARHVVTNYLSSARTCTGTGTGTFTSNFSSPVLRISQPDEKKKAPTLTQPFTQAWEIIWNYFNVRKNYSNFFERHRTAMQSLRTPSALLCLTLGVSSTLSLSQSSSLLPGNSSSSSPTAPVAGPNPAPPLFSVDYHHVQDPFEIALWIMLALLAKLAFHWSGRIPAVVPESCLLIMVGLLVGGVIYGVRHRPPPALSADAFFLYLLPPIVLDAGYFLPGRLFFENLGTILWYAVLGTVWNVLGISLSLYGICQISSTGLENMTLLHCLQFGSLIAAVDPVAVLSVFEEIHVNEQLHILVFGESLLNDAVTVVLYKLFESFLRIPSVSGLDVLAGGCKFLVVGLGGLCIGLFFGLVAALTTRFTARAQVIAPLFVFLFSYLSYLTSEMLHLSGIMAIVTCAVSMKQYVEANVSQESNTTIKYFLKMWSSVSETLIFIFLGVSIVQDTHEWSWAFIPSTLVLCLFWRALGVLLLTAVMNKLRRNPVTFRDQFIIAYGGLRGAICFSLVFLIDEFPQKKLFITTTIVVILFTVFVQGMTIKPMVELLDVKRRKRAPPTLSEEIHSRLLDHLLTGIEDIIGHWGQHYWKDKFEQFNKEYLKKFLIREDTQLKSSIVLVHQELERREQIREEDHGSTGTGQSSEEIHVQSKPLDPEELENIRRVLTRNLHSFNRKQFFAYSRHAVNQDFTVSWSRNPHLHRYQSLHERRQAFSHHRQFYSEDPWGTDRECRLSRSLTVGQAQPSPNGPLSIHGDTEEMTSPRDEIAPPRPSGTRQIQGLKKLSFALEDERDRSRH
ncbi:hypothetical protein GJAV_G00198320 [Gymnothorax javanicus]|nr:hypothetical protein GJAV_G00198320 [Gymnothorax javanicus]